jgi:ribose transport system permease protein
MAAALSNPIIKRILRIPPAYFVFAALLLVLVILRPHMMNANVMGIFIRQIVPLGILVLGQLLVMRIKSIDLSGGGIILLTNYFISSGHLSGASLWLFIALTLVTGTLIGMVNGYLIAKRRVSAVIVTLAVSIILVGLSFALWLFLSQTVFGRYVDSVGENTEAAHFAGVPVERTVWLAHAMAGFFAAIAALVQTASIAVGSVRVGLDLPILAVAATILGGVVFGRGEGGVWGPFFGVLSFALLFVVMTTFSIDEPGKLIAQGLIILLAAIFYGVRTKNS